MISKIIKYLEDTNISFIQWILGFIGILFIRFFLENISSHNYFGIIISDIPTLLHYALFCLGLLLSITLLLKAFTPLSIITLTKLSLFILPVIWLAPIIDLIISWGQVFSMSYHFQTTPQLFQDFFSFFGNLDSGITIGIRIELIILLLGILLFVYKYSKKISKAIIATVLCYTVFFIWLAAPSIIFMVNDIFNNTGKDIYSLFIETINNSIISQNILQTGLEYSEEIRADEMNFNYSMIQIFIILNLILLALWSFLYSKIMTINLIKNSRPRRLIFYLSFIIIGITVAYKITQPDILWNWLDITSLLCLIIAFYAAWMFSVGTNDIHDEKIDKISNRQRPLVTNSIDTEGFKRYNFFFIILSLVAAYAAGSFVIFFVLTFIFAYYIYSSPPFRLKRIPIISTFLISVAVLSVTMASFYLISADKSIFAFPINIAILIIIVITLIANIKDIKDYYGDRTDDIKNFMTIYGQQKGKKIISILTTISFILVPIILNEYYMLFPALVMAIISYLLINRDKFKEKQIFYLYFIFIIIILFQY